MAEVLAAAELSVDLAGLGEVAAGHYEKRITPRAPLALEGACLKWYDIARADAPVPEGIHALARSFVARQVEGDLSIPGELGFVVLHRCGEGFYFLLLSTWRHGNELWETVYAKDGQADFALFPRDSAHKPTFCVWELGAVWHEQQAWSRYLRSGRDEAARRAWLADACEGPV